MAQIISLNPKITKFPESPTADHQMLNVYRMMTAWFLAAMQEQNGMIHFSKESFEAAGKILADCGEMPTFRLERYEDGCFSVELVHEKKGQASQ